MIPIQNLRRSKIRRAAAQRSADPGLEGVHHEWAMARPGNGSAR
jgi:hypothetical protein